MLDPISGAEEFLIRHHQHQNSFDAEELSERIGEQIETALKCEDSSFMMLPTYIAQPKDFLPNGRAVAIDAGGTRLRVGLGHLHNSAVFIENPVTIAMPGSGGAAVSSDEFFSILAELIAPLTKRADSIGFCFSFPVEATSAHDAVVQYLSKEVRIDGLTGLHLGDNLNRAIVSAGGRALPITIVNDTAACYLAGKAKLSDEYGYGGAAALIAGTGINLCYPEQDLLVNTECGGYTGLSLGTADSIVDSKSDNPGRFLFEKQTSGAYLGALFTQLLHLAGKDGLLSSTAIRKLESLDGGLTSDDTDKFLRQLNHDTLIYPLCSDHNDYGVMATIAKIMFMRAGKLAAAMVTAFARHMDGGREEKSPFVLYTGGGLCSESLLFAPQLERHLADNLKRTDKRHVVRLHSPGDNLGGAVIASALAEQG